MHYHIITIFPNMLDSYLTESIIGRAIKDNIIHVHTYKLRDYTTDKHRRVDGRPYSGGPGMVMWVDPIINCYKEIEKSIEKRVENENRKSKTKKLAKSKVLVVNFSPGGEKFDTSLAKVTAKKYTDIIFICGRYEGVDSRVVEILKAKEWSIGDYVLTGGELPAMICIDSISRQIDGVLHASDSLEENRVSSHKVYARPEVYEYKTKTKTGKDKIKKFPVPKVLLSGNHKLIEDWKIESKE